VITAFGCLIFLLILLFIVFILRRRSKSRAINWDILLGGRSHNRQALKTPREIKRSMVRILPVETSSLGKGTFGIVSKVAVKETNAIPEMIVACKVRTYPCIM
jgi:hypothetical protein